MTTETKKAISATGVAALLCLAAWLLVGLFVYWPRTPSDPPAWRALVNEARGLSRSGGPYPPH